jgi:DNA-binding CsgD family transcriptional regulator
MDLSSDRGDSLTRAGVFVGRAAEVELLGGSLATAADGRAQVILIEGPAGVGKTALVERFVSDRSDRSDRMAVLRASGDENETDVAWGVLSQLAASAGLDGWATKLAALGSDVDPVPAAGDLLGILSELQGDDRTVVVVVDDAHLADAASTRALVFAVRRLLADRVLVVLTARPGALPGSWDHVLSRSGGHHQVLGGLSAGELAELADLIGAGRLGPRAAARLHDQTDGHPLYARALLGSVGAAAFASPNADNLALPPPPGLAAVVLAELAECSTDTRDLVTAAAVLGRHCRVADAVVVGDVSAAVSALDQAVRAGLLVQDPASPRDVTFRHALVRAAVYQDLSPARRVALHARAADATSGATRLRHRLAASVGPDETLAADLAAAGGVDLRRGALVAGAEHLRQAAEVSFPGDAADRRLLDAVEALLRAGEADRAWALQPLVEKTAPGPYRDYVVSYLALVLGRLGEAERGLREAWAALATGPARLGPPDLAGRVAANLATLLIYDFRTDEMVRWGEVALAEAGRRVPEAALAWFLRILALGATGRAVEALELLADSAVPDGADVLTARGVMKLWLGDLTGAVQDLGVAFARARAGESVRVTQGVGFLAEAEYRMGRFDQAVEHAELAIGASYDSGRVWDFPLLHSLATYPRAARGDFAEAEAHAKAATEWAELVPLAAARAYAAISRIALGLARQDWRAVVDAAAVLDATYDGAEAGNHVCGPAAAEALIELGRLEEAEEALERYERLARAAGRPSALLGGGRVRGSLEAARGNTRAARAAFEAGRAAADGLTLPLEWARLDAAQGAAAARAGNLSEARALLKDAFDALDRIGARPYAAVVRAQLAAVGAVREPHAGIRLSPAEAVVARLVGDGLSNRAIAEELIVSVKTVEYHLSNIYRRLQVSSRVNLARLVNSWPSMEGGTTPSAPGRHQD